MSGQAHEEHAHFSTVIATFKDYARYSLNANNRRRKDVYSLPMADQQLISTLGYTLKLDEVDKAIKVNADFLATVVESPDIFGPVESNEQMGADSSLHEGSSHAHEHGSHESSHSRSHSHSHQGRRTSEFDMDKLRSTLKQLVRDWSEEGQDERDKCYRPLTDALLTHFSDIPEAERGNFRVLVPGAGLGRLAFDVAKLGFTCQANEFSHYMLLASYFILNRTSKINQYTIYPYVHSFSNIDKRDSMLRPIFLPDVLPADLPDGSNFSLVAGDFEEIYGGEPVPGEPEAGIWDAVLTCFFIDTAKNIVNYLRVIHKILAPEGVWINLGPLLWHWENNDSNEPSIELDLEEVKALARSIGFEILPGTEREVHTTYTNNKKGMLDYTYRAAFFVARKLI